MTYKNLLTVAIVLLFQSASLAQDKAYARSIIDTLASPQMFGRGYVNKGDSLAAAYIASQFAVNGLETFSDDYYQPFTLSMNTFPGRMSLAINGKPLLPGEEFTVKASSHSDKGRYRIRRVSERMLEKPARLKRLSRLNNTGHYIFFDINMREIQSREQRRLIDSLLSNNVAGARGVMFPQSAISWHAWARPMSETPFTAIDVHRGNLPRRPVKLDIDVEALWIDDYVTRNVIAWIPGKTQPDSFLVVTAHYDHIGMMGEETVFPGANDNASGTAMLIDLARHYSLPENRHDYSMAFMAFSGEETGLLGSKYYTENPYFPLGQISFLINLDMVGTGGDGMLVFNGTTDSVRFEVMNNINEQNQYLKELRMRGVSRSSDHYYFHINGVPAFFLLTFGSEHRHYHNIWDTRESLPLTKYEEVFRLITDFFDTF